MNFIDSVHPRLADAVARSHQLGIYKAEIVLLRHKSGGNSTWGVAIPKAKEAEYFLAYPMKSDVRSIFQLIQQIVVS